MDKYEATIQGLMRDIKKYNYIEFYHEENYVREQIRSIRRNLNEFKIYMPKYQMKVNDMSLAINQIKVDIKERLSSFFQETDHTFSLENYDYILKSHNNEYVAKIYKQLGPFDYYQDGARTELDDPTSGGPTDQKNFVDRFDKRKSGTVFRGELN